MHPQYIFHQKCNFCHNKRRKILYSFIKQHLVRCQGCRLIYFDRQRSDLENLYGLEYYSHKGTISDANYVDYESQEKTMTRNFSFAYSFLRKPASSRRVHLLEIGAGYGYFLEHLPPKIKVEAVEVSKEAVGHLKELGVKTHLGEISTLKLKLAFDVIVMFDVIEHQLYFREFMQELYRLLKIDGYIIFTTPDYGSLLNRVLRKNAPTIQPLYHNYYFTQDWLRTHLPTMGFKIVSLRTAHLTFLSIGQIFLMISFALPFTRKLRLISAAKKLHIDKLIIPFLRVGGIECIIQKYNV